MTRLANQHKAINLAQGFPDFDGPEFAKSAAIEAIRGGMGQYARMSGLPALCGALARKYELQYGLSFDADSEITVTSGATEAIFAAIQGLVEPGDEVMLFEPAYDSYRASVVLAGAVPRFVPLEWPDFHFDETALARAFTPRTRAILLNSPHNPTGKVFSPEELEVIARLCIENDTLCITDEVYEHLVYDAVHLPIASLPGMRERTVTISSFGKTFSLTGWKIGWAAAAAPLSHAVRAAHQFITFATATPLQQAAAESFEADPEYLSRLAASYREKRDFLVGALERIGFDVRAPRGTYFVTAGFERFGFDGDVAFCRHLVETIGVAAIPPSVFYEDTTRPRPYVRFAFCKRQETLQAAVDRLQALRTSG